MQSLSTKCIALLPGIFSFIFISVCFVPTVFAQGPTYTPIIGLPGLQNLNTDTTLPQYINAIYVILIILGGIIGVLKIAFAGVKYSLSDIVTDKGAAIKSIKGVFLGLALLLLPYVVLNTINPNLVNLDVLKVAKKTNLSNVNNNTGVQNTGSNQSNAESQRLLRSTPEAVCLDTEGNTWLNNTCCSKNMNTNECLAKSNDTSPVGSGAASDEWQFKAISRDLCSAKAKDSNRDMVFTQTSSNLGNCDLYPKP